MSTLKKKVYPLVVVLALLALAANEFMLRGPSRAQGEEGGAAATGAFENQGRRCRQQEGTAQEQRALFPANLPEIRRSAVERNPFAWPEQLVLRRRQRMAGGGAAKPEVSAVRKPGQPLPVKAFLEAHRITGVFADGPAAVIIDDTLIEAGQKFDQSELLRVAGDSAFFQCLDGVAELKVQTPGPD